MFILYLLIGLLATFFGSMAGLSGGVIIKPVLDFFGHYDLASIGVLSSVTVLAMSSVSLLSSKRHRHEIEKKQSLLIALGSIVGGTVGKSIFNSFLANENIVEVVGIIQSSMLIGILLLIFFFIKFRHRFKTFAIKNEFVIILVGLILGMTASFLGIGGGPLNVAILGWLFSMDTKRAALNSIFIIFFAQLSSVLVVLFTTNVSDYNLTMLPFMVLGGVSGGLLGSRVRIWLSVKQVELIFNTLMITIILINIFNMISF